MRLPLITLNEWVQKFKYLDDTDINRLFKSFEQEFMLQEDFNKIYLNNNIYIIERYGSYNCQLKFCKEFADVVIEDMNISNNLSDFNIKYNLTRDILKVRYKNLFFKEIDIICNSECQTGYSFKESVFNNKTMEFDKVVIYINIKIYNSKKDITISLMHELTHVWDDLKRHQQPKLVKTLADIHTQWYKNIIKKFNSNNGMDKYVAQLIYTFSKIERNAYISELTAVFKTDVHNKKLSYTEAFETFKNSEAFERFSALKNYLYDEILLHEGKITTFCIAFNKLKKTNWSEQKIIKYVKHIIDKTFNKILTVIPKIYYDFVSDNDKELDESVTENYNHISEVKYNRLKKIFHSNCSVNSQI